MHTPMCLCIYAPIFQMCTYKYLYNMYTHIYICMRHIHIYATQVCECGCECLMYATPFSHIHILTSFNTCATCTRICFFVCMHECMCVYVGMCANVGMYVCIHKGIMYIYNGLTMAHTSIYPSIYLSTHTYIYLSIYLSIYLCKYLHVMCKYIYTRTHTYKQLPTHFLRQHLPLGLGHTQRH